MHCFNFKSKNFWIAWQKVVAVILCVSMVWGPMAVKVKAERIIEGGVKYESSNDGLVVVGYDESNFPQDGIVSLKKETIKIEDYAFKGCEDLRSITIPGSVKTVGVHAFYRCEGLEEVKIEDGVESIELNAFGWCRLLKSITIPNSVEYIRNLAFVGCEALTKVYVGINHYYDVYILLGNSGVELSNDGKTFKNSEGKQGELIFYEDITPPAGGNPIRHYVDSKGETSVEITGNDIFWLREESIDVYTRKNTHAWYGIDNRDGVFQPGSYFHVRWISKQEDPDKYNELMSNFDLVNKVKNWWYNKSYIFEVGVTKPNDEGGEYKALSQSVKMYVQLGDDWNLNSLKAYWIGSGMKDDENVDINYEDSDSPEDGTYGIMSLKHFSPYIVLDDPLDGEDESDLQLKVVDSEQDEETETAKNTNGEGVSSGAQKQTEAAKNTSGSEKSGGAQKQTGDVTSIAFIGMFGLLVMLSAAYLMIQKRKNSSKL